MNSLGILASSLADKESISSARRIANSANRDVDGERQSMIASLAMQNRELGTLPAESVTISE